MHILNAIFRFTRGTFKYVFDSLDLSSPGDERHSYDVIEDESFSQDPVIRRDISLTERVEFFEDSSEAIYIFLFHATIYYSSAIIAFSYTIHNWPIVDSMYYATTVFTTVGYGDLAPDTIAGKVFHMCLSMYGIVILGIFIGIVGEKLLEMHNKMIVDDESTVRQALMKSLSSIGHGDGVLSPQQPDRREPPPLYSEIFSIVLLEAPIVFILFVIASVIGYFEGWSLLDSSYWLIVTGTTVGFGDFTPTSRWTRLAAIFFLPLAVAVLGEFLARIASAYIDRKRDRKEKEFFNRTLTTYDLDQMDTSRSGYVDEVEFLTYMLVSLNKIDADHITEIRALFHKLDKTKDGRLSKADLTGHLQSIQSTMSRSNAAN